MTDRFAPGSVIEQVALFPLPQAVLFPNTLMPLHIFEPRYRQMTRDALDSDRLLCVSFITNETELDDNGHPPVADIAGVGEIVEYEELPDGRFHLALVGRARTRIVEHAFVPPYRRVRATVLATTEDATSEADVAALISTATRFASNIRPRQSGTELELPELTTPGRTADAFAHALVLEGAERQELLETLDDSKRVRRCAEALAVQHAMLGKSDMLH